MKTVKITAVAIALLGILMAAVNGEVIYEQAFIGSAADDGNDVETIDTRIHGTSSGIIDYNHGVNLSSALGVGGGGSAMHAGGYNDRVLRSTDDIGYSYTIGQETWYAAVMRVTNPATNNISLMFDSYGSVVNDFYLDITGTTASATYYQNSGTNTVNLYTGVTAGTDYLFLAKVASDAAGGTSAINDISVWFNPTDLSSEAQLTATALGTFTDLNAKIGRTTVTGVDRFEATFDGIGSSDNAFLDQVYIAESLADLSAAPPIPEPSTTILTGLGLAGVCLRRRRPQR